MKKKSILLRQVAKGIGLPYKLLAKDLKNIKFSRSAETMLAHDAFIKRMKEKYTKKIIISSFNKWMDSNWPKIQRRINNEKEN